MAEAAATLGLTVRSKPTDLEIWALHESFLHPLIEAIRKCPRDHQGQHIGIIMHCLLLGLPRDEQHDAFRYLQTVLRQSTPGTH
jgi:hypothetical protein